MVEYRGKMRFVSMAFREYLLADGWLVNGKPDMDMYLYQLGYDFSLDSFKKAKRLI